LEEKESVGSIQSETSTQFLDLVHFVVGYWHYCEE
jgi:hypothetical protein